MSNKKEFDFVEYWANYAKVNPQEAKRKTARFVNAIFAKHAIWRKALLSKPNGVQILAELYEVKNPSIINRWKEEARKLKLGQKHATNN